MAGASWGNVRENRGFRFYALWRIRLQSQLNAQHCRDVWLDEAIRHLDNVESPHLHSPPAFRPLGATSKPFVSLRVYSFCHLGTYLNAALARSTAPCCSTDAMSAIWRQRPLNQSQKGLLLNKVRTSASIGYSNWEKTQFAGSCNRSRVGPVFCGARWDCFRSLSAS